MNKERLMMEGKLAGFRRQEQQLTLKIEGLCSGIRQSLNTALSPAADLDIPLAAQQMRELEVAYMELQGVSSRIVRLKKELGL